MFYNSISNVFFQNDGFCGKKKPLSAPKGADNGLYK